MLYESNPRYDTVIIGTGMAALTVAALLAESGQRVCMLEAHDLPGGYVHTFGYGDFSFCAQIHYIWGCGEGDRVWRFLEKLGLNQDIAFDALDPDGYDHVILPDGKRVAIPYGYDRLAQNIEAAYPGQGARVRAFTAILDRLTAEVIQLPDKVRWWQYPVMGWRFMTLLRYQHKTLQQVFDECALSREAQAVLIANAGNFMCPPKDLAILAYNGLFSGYNRGAYYPRKHFKHLVERHHVPDLRKHIVLHVAGSPTTNEDFCWAPRGHSYGQHLTPANMGMGRLKATSPWTNFFWCNAASGYPGVNGTIGTGMELYMHLTGDRFWNPRDTPSAATLHRQLLGR